MPSGLSDAANPYHQNEATKWYRRSALWECNLQRFDNQLHPAVFLDGQQSDDLRASCDNNSNDGSSSGVHEYGVTDISLILFKALF